MNRSGEEQERLLALLEEEAERTHSTKSQDQREGLTLFHHQNSHLYREGAVNQNISWSDKRPLFCWFYPMTV